MNKLLLKINEKLEHKGLTPTSWRGLKQFYNHVSTIDDDLLLTTKELDDFFEENHNIPEKESTCLFVPGRVVVVWDKGENDNHSMGGIVTDCGMKQLRQVELDLNLAADHSLTSYRNNMTKLCDQLHNSI